MLHGDHETRLLLAREHQATLRRDVRRARDTGVDGGDVLEARRRTHALRELLRIRTRHTHRPASSAT